MICTICPLLCLVCCCCCCRLTAFPDKTLLLLPISQRLRSKIPGEEPLPLFPAAIESMPSPVVPPPSIIIEVRFLRASSVVLVAPTRTEDDDFLSNDSDASLTIGT
uniref:Putative secreted protein n=1 Tax=Anopheles darlingi TaxID=43151 RepID=A0A2M4D6C9_ANODA